MRTWLESCVQKVLCRDGSFTKKKIMAGFADVTDTEGKTIEEMLQRIPSFQDLNPEVLGDHHTHTYMHTHKRKLTCTYTHRSKVRFWIPISLRAWFVRLKNVLP